MSLFLKLGSYLPKNYLILIEKEFVKLNESYIESNITSVAIHSSRFSELISSMICFIELKKSEDVNKIDFDKNINQIMQLPKHTPEREILTHMIPLVLRSIYTIRSKKIAHYKTNLPMKVDMKYIKQSVDWIIAQLCILYLDLDDIEIISFLEHVSRDEFEQIQIFENGEIIFFDEKISLPQKILYVLHQKSVTSRVSSNIIKNAIKPKSNSYFLTSLNRLEERKLISINSDGIRITKKGIKEVKSIRRKLSKNSL